MDQPGHDHGQVRPPCPQGLERQGVHRTRKRTPRRKAVLPPIPHQNALLSIHVRMPHGLPKTFFRLRSTLRVVVDDDCWISQLFVHHVAVPADRVRRANVMMVFVDLLLDNRSPGTILRVADPAPPIASERQDHRHHPGDRPGHFHRLHRRAGTF